ncbi:MULTISPECIES: hypothetical protein [unclassified Pseudonocardia]|jgi:hypothetical protein|uniref:hypothetical protein n=1 Tax=unclassified Pseudonocardia TaxID=2619320 RepID=UPI000968814A|nr:MULTISPECIES: hypothetical protein [unclassified Pseudonocardia]MBN9097287.1 hypothetical protein [Pseudonocardia sp.]OJY48855.1 MAG: hypothetical protein BGP03_08655 [Pseudonocardia sp. 73-21]
MDPHLYLAHLHAADLRAAADAHRLARELGRRDRRPALPVRLYCRLWWAARPRPAAWPPSFLPGT